ncbi:MAG: DUF6505 family protein [Pseudomonadota bacterium]
MSAPPTSAVHTPVMPEGPLTLARTLRFDASDENVFDPAAEPGEWAISGAFAFSNLAEADLAGPVRQAFANGWLGLESFGRATFVATAPIEPSEYAAQVEILAAHFVAQYGAPDLDAARPVAAEELAFMASICADHDANTLLVVERSLVEAGVNEAFRAIRPREATLDLVAVHGSADPD